MKASDNLFELIHSLSPSERKNVIKYFLLNNPKGDANHVKLFDAISKQNTYDEKEIIQILKKDIIPSQFSYTKNYLYNTILDALLISEVDIKIQLRNNISKMDILLKKVLINQCVALLKKTKEIALKYEYFDLLLELKVWEFRLFVSLQVQGNKENIKDAETIYTDYLELQNSQRQIMEIRKFSLICSIDENKRRIPINKEILDYYTTCLDEIKDLFEGKLDSSITSEIFYKRLKCIYLFISAQYDELYLVSTEIEHLFNTHTHFKEIYPVFYIESLRFKGISLIEKEEYHELDVVIKILQKIKTIAPFNDFKIPEFIDTFMMIVFRRTKKFHQLIDLSIQFTLPSHKNKNEVKNAYYQIVYAYIGIGNYQLAKKYLNNLLDETEVNIREDRTCFTKILEVIIDYELQNYDLVYHKLNSISMYIQRKKMYCDSISVFIKYMNKAIKFSQNAKNPDFFEKMKNELLVIFKENKVEKLVLSYFDFTAWAESKIQKKTMAELGN